MEFGNLTHYDPSVVEAVYDESGNLYDEDGSYIVPQASQYGEGEYQETQTILADGGDRFGVSAIYFDRQEELLWMGNQGGHVTSYYGPELQKYTSFQIHATEEVRDISTFDGGILALTQSALRVQIRRGIPVYTHTSENLVEMQAMLQWSPTHVLLGGHQPHLIDFDFNTAQECQVLPTGNSCCAILRAHSRFICGGDPAGTVRLMDPSTLRVEHSLETHSGMLSDMDIHGNLLVTCGYSQRPNGLAADTFLMVHDLRMMRAVSPISVVIDPLLLRFLPSFSSRLAVISAMGQMQLIDTAALTEAELCLYQMTTANTPLCMDVAASCQFLSIGDTGGEIHLFSSSAPNASFNSFSRDTEFADPVEPFPSIAFDDLETSLPQLPYMPGVVLASDWPAQFLKQAYRPTPPIDPGILKSMKIQGTIGYAPNPMKTRRNQIPYHFDSKGGNKMKGPDSGRQGVGEVAIPKRYRWTELKHSYKDEHDYDSFNKTNFCGLTAHLPNNYCNVMLQLLYFMEPVRCLTIGHMCRKEFCLTCELGFLYSMMDKMRKAPCQANNFLRSFRTVPEASALGLILNDLSPEAKRRQNLGRLIQNWSRFILHQIHAELLDAKRHLEDNADEEIKDKENELTQLSELFGMKQMKINRCLKCATDIRKPATLLLCNLTYPQYDLDKEESFCSVLEKSLCPEQTTPAWCDKCNKFRPTLQLKRLEALPHILALNCGMDNPSDKTFWSSQMELLVENAKGGATLNPIEPAATSPTKVPSSAKPCRYGQHCSRGNCRFKHPLQAEKIAPSSQLNQLYYTHPWLPMHIQINLHSNGNINIHKLKESELDTPLELKDAKQARRYDLVGVVCHVTESEERKNLVVFIRMGPKQHERVGASPATQWYLFNNMCVSPVPEQEVTWFSMEWKVPCVLYWVDRDLPAQFMPSTIVNPITIDVFADDKSIARNRGRKHLPFTPLGIAEMPKKGELVAMDAEFVTLNQEEAELRSDGKLSTVKPSQMSVARITCIRGQGPLEGTPFIDDYISTQEQVFDYLTKFSGIQPGDLDANFSSKHLTTLKSSYLKLRFLVDIGVKFIGHGLRNDFRVINISVPSEQVIDTVLLFHLPHQRMISLRFLAWHFLGMKIQSVTHDSVEDARAALQLYYHYLKLQKEGVLMQSLHQLYEIGTTLHFKVPDDDEDRSVEWDVSDEET